MKRINICFTINDAYAKYLGVTLASILKNARPEEDLHFYILNSGLSPENKQKIEQLKSIKDFDIEYLTVSERDLPPLPANANLHVSQETNFRLLLSSLKPDLDKVLCLDCDLIVLSSLWELYNLDLSDYWAAFAVDAPTFAGKNASFIKQMGITNYFNTGVCLINLAAWRKYGVEKIIFRKLQEHAADLRLPDQDLLNLALANNGLEIAPAWNIFVGAIGIFYPPQIQKEMLANKKIIHWAGPDKPWKNPLVLFGGYFRQYARQTPFYEEILQANSAENKRLFRRALVSLPGWYLTSWRCRLLKHVYRGDRKMHYQVKQQEMHARIQQLRAWIKDK